MYNNLAAYGYPPQNPYNFQPQNNINRQPQVFNQNTRQGYNFIAVNSRNEADAVIADLNGTPVFIFNAADNEFYIKRFDASTASTIFNEYKKISPAAQPRIEEKAPQAVNLYKENFQALNDKIDGLKSIIENLTVPKIETSEKMQGGKNAK